MSGSVVISPITIGRSKSRTENVRRMTFAEIDFARKIPAEKEAAGNRGDP